MRSPIRRRAAAIAVVIGTAGFAGACTEKLDGGSNCAAASLLCPGQTVDIRDTIIDPTLAFDSTFPGFPSRGTETGMSVIAHGEDLETVAIIRFDTLITRFIPPGDTAQDVKFVDSSFVKLHLDLRRSEIPDSVRVEIYDVGTASTDDTAAAPVLARFVPQFRIGSKTIPKAAFVDSALIPISDSAMFAHVRDSSFGQPRLRIGVRVGGPGPVSFRLGAIEGGNHALLRYRPKNDTGVHQQTMVPASAGPVARDDVRRDLMDYSLVLRNTLPNPPGTMMLGGVPGRRVYLRFALPRRLTDSTTIIRATLRLNQVPFPVGGANDTVVVNSHLVLAGPGITDHRRASTIISSPGLFISDSLILLPKGSGVREIEMYPLVRAWGAQGSGPNIPPRAIVLAVSDEGAFPRFATFSSSSAAAGLRPRMRLTYIQKSEFGVP